MRFVLVHFDHPDIEDKVYARLAEGCIKSIRESHKKAEIAEITMPVEKDHPEWMRWANNVKLKIWLDNLKGDTVFLDADTIVLSDVSKAFLNDLTYTKRYNADSNIPFNSGVVFVRESGRGILQSWLEWDEALNADRKLWHKWQKVAFGYNQASFAALLSDGKFQERISHVPSYIYNSCDPSDWNFKFDLAKIVHVKSRLREAWQKNKNTFPILQRISKYYKK
jgi:hypothetical protein